MTDLQLIAILSGPPWHRTREQILSYSDWYISHVLFHPRDKNGEIERHAGKEMTHEEVFRWTWGKRGKTEAEIDELWRKYLG